MAFLELPTELLQGICALCPNRDVRNLRLTCRTFNAVASDFLYSTVRTFMYDESLDHLTQLETCSPNIRNGVKTLIFHMDALEDFDNEEWWNSATRRRWRRNSSPIRELLDPSIESWRYRYNERPQLTDEKRPGFEEFVKVNDTVSLKDPDTAEPYIEWCLQSIADQEDMVYDEKIRSKMAAFMTMCPKLTELKFKVRDSQQGIDAPAHETYFQRGLLFPYGHTEESEEALLQTLLAAHDASRHIKRMENEEIDHQCLIDEPEVLEVMRDFESLHWQFGKIFSHMVEELEDTDTEIWESTVESMSEGHLLDLLRPTTKLQTLRLNWWIREDWPLDGLVDLAHLVGDLHWPHLGHLQLGGFKSSAQLLTGVLFRHKDTLESIALTDVYLTTGGEWDECFRSWAGQFPKLKEFSLEGHFRAASRTYYYYPFDDGRMSKYLLRGGKLPAKPHTTGAETDPSDASIAGESISDDSDWSMEMPILGEDDEEI